MSNPFFAVFIESSYHVEGDERSRTNPGHGYPAHTVRYTEVKTFDSEEEFPNWIECEERAKFGKKKYRAVKCYELAVTTRVDVNVNVDHA